MFELSNDIDAKALYTWKCLPANSSANTSIAALYWRMLDVNGMAAVFYVRLVAETPTADCASSPW